MKKPFSIVTITSGSVVLLVAIALGTYFFNPKVMTTIISEIKDTSPFKRERNGTILSSLVSAISPLESMYLVFDDQKVYLVQQTARGETRAELPATGKYIREIIKDSEKRPRDMRISMFRQEDIVLIEVSEDIPTSTEISAPDTYRAVFAVNVNTSLEKKLYVLRYYNSNAMEGGSNEPVLITLWDKHDLIFNCNLFAPFRTEALDRIFGFSGCSTVSLVEDYAQRRGNWSGNTQYDYAYFREKKGYTYFDKSGKVMEPRVLSITPGESANLYTRTTDLLLGKIFIATGSEDVVSGGDGDRKTYELKLEQ